MTTCDCSEEYGPCEQHCDQLVSREGASSHTADELALIRIDDCVSVGAEMTAEQRIAFDALSAHLAIDENPRSGCAWFSNPDWEEEAFDLADAVESSLPDRVYLFADDGYVIVRLHDDCPLLSF